MPARGGAANAEMDKTVRIGSLGDQSSIAADVSGVGSVTAARMAIEDSVQAQASGAKVIALANAANDTVTSVKQANEFGIGSGDQTP